MSCRVTSPDENPEIELLSWRPAAIAEGARSAGADESAGLRAQLNQVEQQCERRVREAHAAGRREGEEAGRARGLAEVQPVIDRLARTIDELAGLRAHLRAEAEADLVQLSLAIARRILHRELGVDPDALHGLVMGALAKMQAQEVASVRVHPSHAAAITACLHQNLNAGNIRVIADPSRDVGAVIFETPRGNLDAGIESQLHEIERGLADRLRTTS